MGEIAMAKDARWFDWTPTQGKRRFGKRRVFVQGCECDEFYTCRACLDDLATRNLAEQLVPVKVVTR